MADKKKDTKKDNAKEQGFVKRMFVKYREIIIYIFVGGLTTLVRWGTTPLFESILRPLGFIDGALSFFTTLTSLIVTILFAFIPNKLYVFESKSFDGKIVAKEFGGFIIARAVASVIELAGIPVIATVFGLPTIVPTIIVSVVVLVLNYIFSKLIIFKKRVPAQDETLSEKKAEKIEKARSRKDKLIAVITTVICAAVALVSIVSFGIEMWGMASKYFSDEGQETAVTTESTEAETTTAE